MVALRILPQGLRVPDETAVGVEAAIDEVPARYLELHRDAGGEVIVRREAELMLAVRLELPGRQNELEALVGRGWVKRDGGDGAGRRQARVQQLLGARHRPALWRRRVDPQTQRLELVVAERGVVVRHRAEQYLHP